MPNSVRYGLSEVALVRSHDALGGFLPDLRAHLAVFVVFYGERAVFYGAVAVSCGGQRCVCRFLHGVFMRRCCTQYLSRVFVSTVPRYFNCDW